MRELCRVVICLSLGLAAAGCDTGSVDDDDTVNDMLLCSSALAITGTWAIGEPQMLAGCWPIGTWTYTVTVTGGDCTPAPQPLAQYQFRVATDQAAPEPTTSWIYTYLTDPADTNVEMGVTSGGVADCSGHVRVYSPDFRSFFNMTPALDVETSTITGNGEYEEHTVDQRP